MPECIVCKAYYEEGQRCKRCGSDNTTWELWQQVRPEEQGGGWGLLFFMEPHLYVPLIVTGLALACGLMGMGWFWKGIVHAIRLAAVTVTACGCLIAALAGHSARHEIREQELLKRVRRGRGASLGGAKLRAIVAPAFSIFLVLLVVYAMIMSSFLWQLAEWYLLDPEYLKQVKQLEQLEQREAMIDATPEEKQSEEEGALRERIRRVVPFALMSMYAAFMVSFTYSASLLLALVYAQKMNKALPQPIFLQGNRLAKVVRTQAEEQLDREEGFVVQTTRTTGEGTGEVEGTMLGMFNRLLPAPGPPGGGGKQTALLRRQQEQTVESGNWNWEELERTKDGGIIMKASGRQYVQAPGNPAGLDKQGGQRVVYTVVADPWGRIREIKRDVE